MIGNSPRAWDVIGWFGAACVSMAVPSFIGLYTGSFGLVVGFAAENLPVFLLWSISFIGLGSLIGLFIRGHIDKKRLAAKDAEIEKLQEQLALQRFPGVIAGVQGMAAATGAVTRHEQIRMPSGKLYRNMTAVKSLPVETVMAIMDAYDNDGRSRLSGHEKPVRDSIKKNDGIFILGTGEEEGTYSLTREWIEFVDDPETLPEMRAIVNNAPSVWHTIGGDDE